jgi:quercetin dioxygenase-like cupin family protein
MMHQMIDQRDDYDIELSEDWQSSLEPCKRSEQPDVAVDEQTAASAGYPNAIATVSQPDGVKHVPAGGGAAYWGPGSLMTFLITGEETGGDFFMAEMSVSPGGGTPPHIHSREDESLRMLEGTLTVQVGGDTLALSAGDFVFLPRGIAHSFKNSGRESAKALILVTPAGLENFFAEVFEPAVNGFPAPPPSRELIARSLAASPRYGLALLSAA